MPPEVDLLVENTTDIARAKPELIGEFTDLVNLSMLTVTKLSLRVLRAPLRHILATSDRSRFRQNIRDTHDYLLDHVQFAEAWDNNSLASVLNSHLLEVSHELSGEDETNALGIFSYVLSRVNELNSKPSINPTPASFVEFLDLLDLNDNLGGLDVSLRLIKLSHQRGFKQL